METLTNVGDVFFDFFSSYFLLFFISGIFMSIILFYFIVSTYDKAIDIQMKKEKIDFQKFFLEIFVFYIIGFLYSMFLCYHQIDSSRILSNIILYFKSLGYNVVDKPVFVLSIFVSFSVGYILYLGFLLGNMFFKFAAKRVGRRNFKLYASIFPYSNKKIILSTFLFIGAFFVYNFFKFAYPFLSIVSEYSDQVNTVISRISGKNGNYADVSISSFVYICIFYFLCISVLFSISFILIYGIIYLLFVFIHNVYLNLYEGENQYYKENGICKLNSSDIDGKVKNIKLTKYEQFGINCVNCGNPLIKDAKFCTNCGKNVDILEPKENNTEEVDNLCSNCGHDNKIGAKFCVKCGNKIN